MSKINKAIFTVCTFLFATSCVNAASMCDASERTELNREVVNIKGKYEEKMNVLAPGTFDVSDEMLGTELQDTFEMEIPYFEISLLNLSEKFQVEIYSDNPDDPLEARFFTSTDAVDGKIAFDWEYIDKITTFTVKIFSSDATSCPEELYRTLYITTPRLNENETLAICSQILAIDENNYLCQKYVTYKPIEFDQFMERAYKFIDNNKKAEESEEPKGIFHKFGSFVKKHKGVFIGSGIILVVITGGVVAVIVRKRRSSEL